jgi:hypothetical protein
MGRFSIGILLFIFSLVRRGMTFFVSSVKTFLISATFLLFREKDIS